MMLIYYDENYIANEYNINIKFEYLNDWFVESNKNVIKSIKNYLDVLDCVKHQNKLMNIIPGTFAYDYYVGLLFFHLNRLTNQITYNGFIDEFVNIHTDNIKFLNTNISVNKHLKSKRVSRKKAKNEYVKYTSKDLFNGTPTFTYVNHYTGDEINSSNPNLLEELNAPKVKQKKTKANKSMNNITFSFTKKQ